MDKKKKDPKPKEDKNSDKYKVSLKLVNKILVNIGKEEIDELTKFVDIDREDIIKEVNMKTLTEMEGELFQHFDKYRFGWYRRGKIKTYPLTFLRYLCTDLGFKMIFRESRVQKNTIMKARLLYSIQ